MGVLTQNPRFCAVDDNGNPLSGGLLYTYAEGTSTAKTTYADKAESIANSNPIVLDSNGEATIFLADGGYKFVLNEANSTPPATPDDIRWTVDNITSINFIMTTINKTADYTMLASDFDGTKTFTNYGATQDITLYMPAGAENYSARFVTAASYYLKMKANGTEIITYEGDESAEGGYVRSNEDGTVWEVRWVGDEWVITAIANDVLHDIQGTTTEGTWPVPQPRLTIPSGEYLTGEVVGLNLSYTDADTIGITSGTCYDSTNQHILTLSADTTLDITSSSTEIHHIFVTNDGTIASDTDIDGANIITGTVIYVRWIGCVFTDSSGDIIKFYMSNDIYSVTSPDDLLIGSTTSTTYVSKDVSAIVPTARLIGIVYAVRADLDDTDLYVSYDGISTSVKQHENASTSDEYNSCPAIAITDSIYIKQYSGSGHEMFLAVQSLVLKR